jgi:hypothetical protein
VRVEVTPGVDTLTALGESLRFTAVARGKDGRALSGNLFTWTSSDAGVASVDGVGRATAQGAGTTGISARTGEVSGTATLVVRQVGASVQITPVSDTLRAYGATTQFTASAEDANGNPAPGVTISWASSDGTVATVDSEGRATAVGPGRCTITATADSSSADAEVIVFPPVEGPEPSYRVGAFYYGWYGNPGIDGRWVHWESRSLSLFPPSDITSDYYPLLGPYSVTDPVVLARHMAWLRQAGIGVLIQTWWGRESFSDAVVSPILDAADGYGIKVAFHIEPYDGRSATRLVEDIQYLYDRYGGHPAFFRSTATSRWSPDDRPKGLFFLYASGIKENRCDGECPVEPEYWSQAMEALQALPEGAIVVGHQPNGDAARRARFDGAYDYVTLRQGEELDFSWALSLPPGVLYVPAVTPGFTAKRIDYPPETYLDRVAGQTFQDQWEAAVEPGIEPFMVVITSFNEWHEGTQIEPIATGRTNGEGYTYLTYDPLQSDGYLNLSRQLAEEIFLDRTWPEPSVVQATVETSSDWTYVRLAEEVRWGRPELQSVSAGATAFFLFDGYLHMNQPIDDASSGAAVVGVMKLGVIGPCFADPLVFEIGRGHLGQTSLRLSRFEGDQEVVVATFVWDQINLADPSNSQTFEVACSALLPSG